MLGASVDMSLTQLMGQMLAGTFADILRAHGSPGDILDLCGGEHGILFAVDDQAAVVMLHGAGELAVNGVVLEHIGHIFRVHKGIVDGGDLHILMSQGSAKDKTADAAKTIDTDLSEHEQFPFQILKRIKTMKNRLRKRLFAFIHILSWLCQIGNQQFA